MLYPINDAILRFIIIILFVKSIRVFFSITCLIILYNVNKSTLTLSVIAATALAFVIGPALMQSASAVPAPKTVEGCDDQV